MRFWQNHLENKIRTAAGYNGVGRLKKDDTLLIGNRMSIGALIDKNHQPSEAEIHQVMGSKLTDWQELVQFIREHYPCDEDLKFLYGKKYGWALSFRKHRQLLTSHYPIEDGLTVQVNLGAATIEQTGNMQLGENMRAVIEQATPYPEGRW